MEKLKKSDLYCLLLIFLGCLIFLFANIGLYPLIDLDETRYVNMSKFMYLTKEYITPILNFEPFLEKPPLYFWLNIIVFKFFNFQSLFFNRFATACLGTVSIFMTYFFAKYISKNRLYGLLSAYVLLVSVWFLLFSHIAILDLSFMVFSSGAIYLALMPLFSDNEKTDKFFWFFAWIFMGLSILAKGFIGLAIPCMTVFFTYLFFKKLKCLFKPWNFIPGFIAFLIITLPWHIAIYNVWGRDWINEYILKHHFARLLNSEGLGRKQPFLFYVPIIIAGIIPWAFNFILKIIKDTKELINKIKNTKPVKNIFSLETTDEKIRVAVYIYLISVFLFFSAASTKLPSYILTLFPALALLVADFWIKNEENKKELKISNYINSYLFFTISLSGLLFTIIYPYILPDKIKIYIENAVYFAVPVLVLLFIISVLMIYYTKKENHAKNFIAHIILMAIVAFCTFCFVLPYYTSFSQDELVEYANYIYKQPNSKIVTCGFGAKYSILNPYKKIKYITDDSEIGYRELCDYLKRNKDDVYILTRNKVDRLKDKKEFKKIKEGKIYIIYKYKKN